MSTSCSSASPGHLPPLLCSPCNIQNRIVKIWIHLPCLKLARDLLSLGTKSALLITNHVAPGKQAPGCRFHLLSASLCLPGTLCSSRIPSSSLMQILHPRSSFPWKTHSQTRAWLLSCVFRSSAWMLFSKGPSCASLIQSGSLSGILHDLSSSTFHLSTSLWNFAVLFDEPLPPSLYHIYPGICVNAPVFLPQRAECLYEGSSHSAVTVHQVVVIIQRSWRKYFGLLVLPSCTKPARRQRLPSADAAFPSVVC